MSSRPVECRAVSTSSRGNEEDEDDEDDEDEDEPADCKGCLIRNVWAHAPVAYSKVDTCSPEDALEEEKAELHLMLSRLSRLGLLQFPCMVIFFALALLRQQILAWVILFVKLVAGCMWQRWQLTELQRVLQVNQSDKGQELQRVCADFMTKCWQPRGDGPDLCTVWPLPHWPMVLALGLYEVIDPDWDAMTAGNAEGLINEEQGKRFADSWRRSLPGIGVAVAEIGLPALLQLFVVFSALVQVWFLNSMVRACRESIDTLTLEKTRYFVFADLAHVADLSNMMLTSEVFLVLRQAQLRPNDKDRGRPKDRIHGFVAKIVCETVPAAWLQVSLLALAKPSSHDPLAVVSTVMSVVSSIYAMGKALLLAVPHLRYQWRGYKECHRMLVINSLSVPLTVLMLLACFLRFIGVFVCPSSMLNLTSGCVPPDG